MGRRISLFDDEEELSIEELLEQMETILHIKTARGGPWHARARGGYGFGEGKTAVEAMRAALASKDKGRL